MKLPDVIILILFIISLIIVTWYFFGSSPTLEQSVLVLILTILFTNISKISNLNREVGKIKAQMKNSFENVKKDMRKINKKLS